MSDATLPTPGPDVQRQSLHKAALTSSADPEAYQRDTDLQARLKAPAPADPLQWLHDALFDLAHLALNCGTNPPPTADVRQVDPVAFGKAIAAATEKCVAAGVSLGDIRQTLDAAQRVGGGLLGWAGGEQGMDPRRDAEAALGLLKELVMLRKWVRARATAGRIKTGLAASVDVTAKQSQADGPASAADLLAAASDDAISKTPTSQEMASEPQINGEIIPSASPQNAAEPAEPEPYHPAIRLAESVSDPLPLADYSESLVKNTMPQAALDGDGREKPPAPPELLLRDEHPGVLDPEAVESGPPSEYEFARAGAVWHLQFGDERGDFSDNDFTGFKYVASLLIQPYMPIAIDKLYPVKEQPPDALTSDLACDPEGEEAIRRTQARLKADIEEASASGALGRAEELGVEYNRIEDAHNRNKMKNGKSRRMRRTPREKAADCVRKAIALVQDRLAERGMPNLAAHLKRIQPAGTAFTYLPERPPPLWRISL